MMNMSARAMVECFGAKYASLHVRETNYAAFHLYKDTLKFNVHGVEPKYYADGENAYEMRKPLTREMFGLPPLDGETASNQPASASAPASASTAAAARKTAEKRGRDAVAKGSSESSSSGAHVSEAESSEQEQERVDAAVEAAGDAADIEPGKKALEHAAKAKVPGAK